MKNKSSHTILGPPRRGSGAAKHSWNLAKRLKDSGTNTRYYSKWWKPETSEIDLETDVETPIKNTDLQKIKGAVHLQTHAWEAQGALNELNSLKINLIYTLHAIIPYLFLPTEEKKAFLNGDLPSSRIEEIISQKMDDKQKMQIKTMQRADSLIVISKNHKKVLKRMGIEKPIYVFENPSDIDETEKEMIKKAKRIGERIKERSDTDNLFVYCGSIYGIKGSFDLFEAFHELRKTRKDSKLILLGGGNLTKEELIEKGLKLNDLESLIMVPWINPTTKKGKQELLGHYFASKALIQPMITDELYSKTVIDAMHLGIPTITCKSDYTIGTSKNANEIYDALKEIEQNPAKTQEVVKRAQEKVKRENTWKGYIERLEAITRQGEYLLSKI
jgi:glycosyltransferase involved in cell wall biosynthesis